MAERKNNKEAHKWTSGETRRLIWFRIEHEPDFYKSKIGAKKMWERFITDMGLEGKVTGQQASKKWENLKQKYKNLRSEADMGEVTNSSWQYFEDMHEALGARKSIRPPVLVASFKEELAETSTLEDSVPSVTPTSTPGTSRAGSPARKRRRHNSGVLDFLAEEIEREQRRYEELKATTERFLNLFERLVEKL